MAKKNDMSPKEVFTALAQIANMGIHLQQNQHLKDLNENNLKSLPPVVETNLVPPIAEPLSMEKTQYGSSSIKQQLINNALFSVTTFAAHSIPGLIANVFNRLLNNKSSQVALVNNATSVVSDEIQKLGFLQVVSLAGQIVACNPAARLTKNVIGTGLVVYSGYTVGKYVFFQWTSYFSILQGIRNLINQKINLLLSNQLITYEQYTGLLLEYGNQKNLKDLQAFVSILISSYPKV